MADKTILDFPELFDNLDDDPMYLLRGTGTARDRHQTRLNFLQDILQIGIVEYTITRSYLADISYVNLDGSIYQAIKGNQINGDPLENINKSPDTNPLWWRLVIAKPVVPAFDDTEAVLYETAGYIVESFGTHYASSGKTGNLNKDPDNPQNDDYWIASKGWDWFKPASSESESIPGGMHPATDYSSVDYQQNIKLDTIKRGAITYDVYRVILDGTVVTGTPVLEAIFDPGGAKEYKRIDKYLPDNVGTRTLIDMRGYSTRAMSAGGSVAPTLAEMQIDEGQKITGELDLDYVSTTDLPVGPKSGVFASAGGAGTQTGTAGTAGSNRLITFDSSNSTSPNTAKTNDVETRIKALVRGVDYIIVIIAQ